MSALARYLLNRDPGVLMSERNQRRKQIYTRTNAKSQSTPNSKNNKNTTNNKNQKNSKTKPKNSAASSKTNSSSYRPPNRQRAQTIFAQQRRAIQTTYANLRNTVLKLFTVVLVCAVAEGIDVEVDCVIRFNVPLIVNGTLAHPPVFVGHNNATHVELPDGEIEGVKFCGDKILPFKNRSKRQAPFTTVSPPSVASQPSGSTASVTEQFPIGEGDFAEIVVRCTARDCSECLDGNCSPMTYRTVDDHVVYVGRRTFVNRAVIRSRIGTVRRVNCNYPILEKCGSFHPIRDFYVITGEAMPTRTKRSVDPSTGGNFSVEAVSNYSPDFLPNLLVFTSKFAYAAGPMAFWTVFSSVVYYFFGLWGLLALLGSRIASTLAMPDCRMLANYAVLRTSTTSHATFTIHHDTCVKGLVGDKPVLFKAQSTYNTDSLELVEIVPTRFLFDVAHHTLCETSRMCPLSWESNLNKEFVDHMNHGPWDFARSLFRTDSGDWLKRLRPDDAPNITDYSTGAHCWLFPTVVKACCNATVIPDRQRSIYVWKSNEVSVTTDIAIEYDGATQVFSVSTFASRFEHDTLGHFQAHVTATGYDPTPYLFTFIDADTTEQMSAHTCSSPARLSSLGNFAYQTAVDAPPKDTLHVFKMLSADWDDCHTWSEHDIFYRVQEVYKKNRLLCHDSVVVGNELTSIARPSNVVVKRPVVLDITFDGPLAGFAISSHCPNGSFHVVSAATGGDDGYYIKFDVEYLAANSSKPCELVLPSPPAHCSFDRTSLLLSSSKVTRYVQYSCYEDATYYVYQNALHLASPGTLVGYYKQVIDIWSKHVSTPYDVTQSFGNNFFNVFRALSSFWVKYFAFMSGFAPHVIASTTSALIIYFFFGPTYAVATFAIVFFAWPYIGVHAANVTTTTVVAVAHRTVRPTDHARPKGFMLPFGPALQPYDPNEDDSGRLRLLSKNVEQISNGKATYNRFGVFLPPINITTATTTSLVIAEHDYNQSTAVTRPFRGRRQAPVDVCAGVYCGTGACSPLGPTTFICQCPSSVTGTTCELSSPEYQEYCGTHGVARPTSSSVACVCKEGWTGSKCEYPISDCSKFDRSTLTDFGCYFPYGQRSYDYPGEPNPCASQRDDASFATAPYVAITDAWVETKVVRKLAEKDSLWISLRQDDCSDEPNCGWKWYVRNSVPGSLEILPFPVEGKAIPWAKAVVSDVNGQAYPSRDQQPDVGRQSVAFWAYHRQGIGDTPRTRSGQYQQPLCSVGTNNCRQPCMYGVCVGTSCVCPPGRYGSDCSSSTRCLHGTVVNGKCICASGYTGDDCATETCKCQDGKPTIHGRCLLSSQQCNAPDIKFIPNTVDEYLLLQGHDSGWIQDYNGPLGARPADHIARTYHLYSTAAPNYRGPLCYLNRTHVSPCYNNRVMCETTSGICLNCNASSLQCAQYQPAATTTALVSTTTARPTNVCPYMKPGCQHYIYDNFHLEFSCYQYTSVSPNETNPKPDKIHLVSLQVVDGIVFRSIANQALSIVLGPWEELFPTSQYEPGRPWIKRGEPPFDCSMDYKAKQIKAGDEYHSGQIRPSLRYCPPNEQACELCWAPAVCNATMIQELADFHACKIDGKYELQSGPCYTPPTCERCAFGTCQVTNGTATCVCDPGYSGEFCQYNTMVTSCVNGRSINGICYCNDGFAGASCNLTLCHECPAGSQCRNGVCYCPPTFMHPCDARACPYAWPLCELYCDECPAFEPYNGGVGGPEHCPYGWPVSYYCYSYDHNIDERCPWTGPLAMFCHRTDNYLYDDHNPLYVID